LVISYRISGSNRLRRKKFVSARVLIEAMMRYLIRMNDLDERGILLAVQIAGGATA
jgi:hypothetical protein